MYQDVIDVSEDGMSAHGRFRCNMQAGLHESVWPKDPNAKFLAQWWEGRSPAPRSYGLRFIPGIFVLCLFPPIAMSFSCLVSAISVPLHFTTASVPWQLSFAFFRFRGFGSCFVLCWLSNVH